jgi:hypothetical protein
MGMPKNRSLADIEKDIHSAKARGDKEAEEKFRSELSAFYHRLRHPFPRENYARSEMTELSFYEGYLEGKRRQEEISKLAQATWEDVDGLDEARSWKYHIEPYSLKPGRVGQPTGQPRVVAQGSKRHVMKAFNANKHKEPGYHHLISPKGTKMTYKQARVYRSRKAA